MSVRDAERVESLFIRLIAAALTAVSHEAVSHAAVRLDQHANTSPGLAGVQVLKAKKHTSREADERRKGCRRDR